MDILFDWVLFASEVYLAAFLSDHEEVVTHCEPRHLPPVRVMNNVAMSSQPFMCWHTVLDWYVSSCSIQTKTTNGSLQGEQYVSISDPLKLSILTNYKQTSEISLPGHVSHTHHKQITTPDLASQDMISLLIQSQAHETGQYIHKQDHQHNIPHKGLIE